MISEVRKKAEKRSTEIIIIAVILAAGTAATTYNNTNILNAGTSNSNGLLAEYRFDTGAGNTAYDTSGNNDGTIKGATWTSGVEGNGLDFEGDSAYTNLPNEVINEEEKISASFWLKIPENSNPGGMGVISGANSGNDNEWLAFFPDSDDFRFYSGSNKEWSLPSTIDDGKWHHYVLATDSNDNEAELFVDGRSYGVKIISQDSYNIDEGGLILGQEQDSVGGGFDSTQDYIGKLDSLRFFRKELNVSQVRSLYNRGSWRIGTTTKEDDPSKVLDISFQHQNSSHVYDTSGYENHGTRENGVGQESAVGCKIGRCYSFNESRAGGSGQFVEINPASALDRDEITAMAWIKPKSSADSRAPIVRADEFYFQHYDDNQLATFWYGWSKEGYHYSTSNSVPTGQWSHVAVTWSSQEGVKFYIDGRLNRQIDNSGPGNPLDWIKIGQENADRRYNGKIDQVKVFNRSLSQQEIIEKTQGLEGGGTVLDLRFNRDGGDRVNDYSGEKNHGTLQPNESGGPKWVDGLKGNALKFDGENDQVDMSSFSGQGGDSYSISYWFNLKNSDNGAFEFVSSDAFNTYAYTRSTPLEANFGVFNKSKDDFFVTGTSRDLKFKKWYLFTATVDSENKKAVMYINGERQASTSFRGTLEPIDSVEVNNRREHEGRIDNLKIYSYKLSNSEIDNLYSRGKSQIGSPLSSSSTDLQDGLVLSQTFNRIETCGQSDTITCPSGMSGEVAVDESGEANHGELVKGPSVKGAGDCRVGGCLGFDGDDDTVRIPVSSSLVRDSITLSLWLNLSGRSESGSSYENVVGRSASGGWNLEIQNDDTNTLDWRPNNADTGVVSIPNNDWVHLTFTAGSNQAAAYKNGKIANSWGISDLNVTDEDIWIMSEGGYKYLGGVVDQVRVYNRSLSSEEVWRLYAQGRDRSTSSKGPVLHYPMQTRSSPVADVSGEGNDGNINLLGEIGTFNTSDGEWRTVRFERKYEDPVVVGTSNTLNGESALSFEAKNVDPGSAQVRLCESEGENTEGCDTHGTERASYMVVSASATEDIPGIEAGTLKLDSEIDSRRDTVSYSESFGSAPNVMANVNTDNGKNPVEARVTSFSTSSFNIGICYQDSTNGCDPTHVTEEVGYVALEPGNLPFEQTAETGRTGNSASGSNFVEQTFSNTYQDPAVVVSTVSEDGRQETQIDEAANLGSNSVDVRYCEIENGDVCNSHTSGNVAWFVAEEGLLTYTNGNFPRYVNTERGKALEFDGQDDYIKGDSNFDFYSADNDAWSILVWFYLDRSPENAGDMTLIDNNGRFHMQLSSHQGEGSMESIAGGEYMDWNWAPEVKKWHHASLVYDGKGNLRAYGNGKFRASRSGVSPASDEVSGDFGIAQHIPSNPGNGNNRWFDGKIDDVRIYPYAFSQEQVKQAKNSGTVSVE